MDLLIPRDWGAHVALLGRALQVFRSAEKVENPNRNKPLCSKRLLRLTFLPKMAPREIFTLEDPSVPIWEITLKNGATAVVIHKWNKQNSFPSPSKAQTWKSNRSYAAATQDGSGVTKSTPAMAPTRKEAPASVSAPAVDQTQRVTPFPTTQAS